MRRTVLVGISLVLVAIAVMSTYVWHTSRSARSTTASQEQYWRELIQTFGIDEAKGQFMKSIAGDEPTEAHTESHAFGAALYDLGEPLTKCPTTNVQDEFYSSGCAHEFIGRMISDRGLEAVDDIEAQCASLSRREFHLCEHGIGHGLIGYLGYDLDALRVAVGACARTSDNNCYRAAFMERDFRRLANIELSVRQPEKGEPEHSYCNEFKEPVKSVCVYWQPNWWYALLSPDVPSAELPDLMSHLYTLCDQWSGVYKNLCATGVGFNIYYIGASVPEARAICDSRFGDKSFYCKIGVASRYRSFGVEVPEVQRVCEGLTGSLADQCTHAAAGEGLYDIDGLPFSVLW